MFGNDVKRLFVCKHKRKLGGNLAEKSYNSRNDTSTSAGEGNSNQTAQAETETSSNGMREAAIGSVIGASVGLLASPEAGKRFAGKLGQSEMLKSCSNELRRTAQSMLTEQAAMLMRQGAVTLFQAYQTKTADSGDDNENYRLSADHYHELKAENDALNDRFNRIEDKLNTLLEKMDT
ncbi:hypothetical protein SAMN05216238_101171 [Lentibacillus persicus]|uniref:Gas vesicle protein n=1 Tax=Lentibacillus persicus TaxID=640948 RepID=A0A1I1S0S9_9BACI|nr:hypothetical protein [Lentibacillus persicus]SFD40145.1 hypothetical protein SAMN05216238_101171 [Lentibacillus persicus]